MMRPEDWSGLAPQRDRPQGPEFDWQPETLNLSHAAARVIRAWMMRDGYGEAYLAAMQVWTELTGMDEPAALTYAYQIADAVPPVTGLVPPFSHG